MHRGILCLKPIGDTGQKITWTLWPDIISITNQIMLLGKYWFVILGLYAFLRFRVEIIMGKDFISKFFTDGFRF